MIRFIVKYFRIILTSFMLWLSFSLIAANFAAAQELVPVENIEIKNPVSTEKTIEVELFETRKELESAIRNKEEIAKIIEEAIEEQKNNSIQMVDLANQIRKREFEISKSEKRLDSLIKEEDKLRVDFNDKKHKLVDLIVGLQKISQNKPPALLVNPDDILVAIRNAMIIGNIVPETEIETRVLADKLRRLTNIKNEILIEKKQYESHIMALRKKHEEIENLINAKKRIIYDTNQKLEKEKSRIDTLNSASIGLEDLIDKLKREEITRQKEYTHWLGIHNKDTANGNIAQSELENNDKKSVISLLAQTYLKPDMPFTQAKGKLPFPVIGEVVSLYGEEDEYGSESKGIYVKTKNYAQVISPFSGTVEYAGEFKKYGKLLIINVGENYHIIIAGMNILDAYVGQFIFSGEPVGVMGDRAFKSSSMSLTVENDEPTLYIEIRKNDKSINANDWWQEEISVLKKT